MNMKNGGKKRRRLVIHLILLFSLCHVLAGCGRKQDGFSTGDGSTPPVEKRQMIAMDTFMQLQIYGENAKTAADAATQEIARLEALFSAQDGEVARLNEAHGGTVSEDTAALLQKAVQLYEETDGAFDITIYPVVKAWGFIDKEYRVPKIETILQLLEAVDASAIGFDAQTGRVELPERAELDFGGIAKGYTSDRLIEVLKENKITSAMLNLGGNVALLGGKPDGSEFKIAIAHPEEQEKYLGIVSVKDTSVITSGGYERFFERDGEIYHHIIDPATGYPARQGLASVTIVCADGARADGLSTALFVMGKEKAVSFWREHRTEFDCVLYTAEGGLFVTGGLKDCFSSAYEFQVIE